jgi:hypothetical protein
LSAAALGIAAVLTIAALAGGGSQPAAPALPTTTTTATSTALTSTTAVSPPSLTLAADGDALLPRDVSLAIGTSAGLYRVDLNGGTVATATLVAEGIETIVPATAGTARVIGGSSPAANSYAATAIVDLATGDILRAGVPWGPMAADGGTWSVTLGNAVARYDAAGELMFEAYLPASNISYAGSARALGDDLLLTGGGRTYRWNRKTGISPLDGEVIAVHRNGSHAVRRCDDALVCAVALVDAGGIERPGPAYNGGVAWVDPAGRWLLQLDDAGALVAADPDRSVVLASAGHLAWPGTRPSVTASLPGAFSDDGAVFVGVGTRSLAIWPVGADEVIRVEIDADGADVLPRSVAVIGVTA